MAGMSSVLAGLEAERLKAFASIPLFLFYYLFVQFAIYRARRYRLHHGGQPRPIEKFFYALSNTC